jgi:two-component system nitrate/nitrite response regulator NarL
MPVTDNSRHTIRIVVADDHPIFRQGLIRLIETKPNLKVVGAANDGDETLPLVRDLEPDVLLLDRAMPRMTGMDVLRELNGQNPARTLLLTASIDRADVVEALELGARGVVLKESASDVLFQSIHAVMCGQYWVGRKALPTHARTLSEVAAAFPAPERKHFGLTPRELEIVGVILAGCSNSDIAAKFAISEKTVKHHLTNIFDKLGVSSRLELALFALYHKLEAPNGAGDVTAAMPVHPMAVQPVPVQTKV